MAVVAWNLACQFVRHDVEVVVLTTHILGEPARFMQDGVEVGRPWTYPAGRCSSSWWRESRRYFECFLMERVAGLTMPNDKPGGGMLRAVGLIFSGNLISKLLGIVREMLLAASYGTSAVVGSFRIANTCTFIPINFFVSNTLNAVFLPLYVRHNRHDQVRAQTLFWTLAVILCTIAILISFVLSVFAGQWAALIAPGSDLSVRDAAGAFIKIMAWCVPFYFLGTLFSYLEMAHGGYAMTSARSSVQNIGVIAGLVAAVWFADPLYLAWGLTGSFMAFAALGLHALIRKRILIFPRRVPGLLVRDVLGEAWKTLRPLLLVPILMQANIALERVVSSYIGLEAISGLDYARFIAETGTFLLAVPIGLVGLSQMSGLDPKIVQGKLRKIIPALLTVTVPLSVFLCFYAEPVVRLLFERGAFGERSVRVTAAILQGFGVGFWAQVCGYVLMKVLNAQLRNRDVVIFTLVAISANMALNLLGYRFLGAMVLGLGVSLYGVVLFGCACRALAVWPLIRRHLAWLTVGVVLYVPGGLFLPHGSWRDMILTGILFGVFWLVFFLSVPCLRETLTRNPPEKGV